MAFAALLVLSACGGGSASTSTPPPPVTYSIGGTISGLTGTGLVLQDNLTNNLTVAAGAASFTFSTRIPSGSAYGVTVLTQPSNPTQNCLVTAASGAATANVTSVAVTCTTVSYTIGGSISGLTGTGLVLQDNLADNLIVAAGATSFTFATQIASGGAYGVTVLTQPSNPAQSCVVTNGSGNANANVTTVQITCTAITYTIGGTITGLSGSGLVLQDNLAGNLTVAAGATSFTFGTPIPSGGIYGVTVLTEPSNPAQTCGVTNRLGTANANVTNVQITCANAVAMNEWTWESGAESPGELGVYGTQGVAAASNVPGGRFGAVSWTDPDGNFWLFGGYGLDSVGNDGGYQYLNDLWKYTAGEWTWMSGSNLVMQAGTYGTLGTAASGNVPGARFRAVGWTDAAGNLWLFGGTGLDSNGANFELNDLWKYSAGQWTWMSGSNLVDQPGTYGTLGTPAPGNVPGARDSAVGWTDASGNLWLFGGADGDESDAFNDLWKYGAGEWTWMGGSEGINQAGVYGTLGMPDPGNVPGARSWAVGWTDAQGDFWLFGGYGAAANPLPGYLNDLWKYSAGEWTWMSGSDGLNQSGTYGTEGTPAPGNVPGGRYSAASWTDAAGNLWLFGGYSVTSPSDELNDLWRYSAGEWTWMSGSSGVNQVGVYGTSGNPAPGNVPGARSQAVSWTDTTGNLWLFGGDNGYFLNDLWKYEP